MPASVFLLLSLVGLVFFGLRLVSDPEGWQTYVLGIAACIFLGVRNLKVIRTTRKVASSPSVREVDDRATLNEALGRERAVLYKHSTSCPVSAVVLDDVLRFADTHPDWKIYLLNVLEQQALSDAVAERLGVPHASPQVFVLRQGRPVWHASHYDITAQSLSRHLA